MSGSVKVDELLEPVTAIEVERITSAVGEESDIGHCSSKYPALDVPSDLPQFITVRGTTESEHGSAVWSKATGFFPHNLLETNDQDSFKLGRNQFEKKINKNALSLKSPMLDALNLEEMQAEFARALNPLSANNSDITPAEKPLSAPNTPAKTSLKLVRPASFGNKGKLNFENKSVLNEVSCTVYEENKGAILNGLDVSSFETSPPNCAQSSKLVPPNINLATGRLDRKPGSVDSWVSHSRGSLNVAANQVDETSPSLQQSSSSSKSTFEIGHVFNPTALHLQFQAELNILDSFNESLCQVMEVEKVRAVAMARHQALSEIQSVPVPTEDKSIDVQRSLLKPTDEISTINYQRGSGNPSDITLLDTDTINAAITDMKSMNESEPFVPSMKDGHSSPSSTNASETLGSFIKEKVLESGPSASQEKDSSPAVRSGHLAEKSISEDIYTMSDSVPEEIFPKEYATLNTSREDKPCEETDELLSPSKGTKGDEKLDKVDGSLSVDFSLNSIKADSSFTGIIILMLLLDHVFYVFCPF